MPKPLWWEAHFTRGDVNDRVRVTCSLCKATIDSRAGRAGRHLIKAHGMEEPSGGAGPGKDGGTSEATPPGNPPPTTFPRGSREWLVEITRDLVDSPHLSPSERLKAIGELRELEQYEGAGQFDDETERLKYLDQWVKAIERAKGLRELSRSMLRDHDTRQDLIRALEESR